MIMKNQKERSLSCIKEQLKKHYKKINTIRQEKKIKIIEFIHPFLFIEKYTLEQELWKKNYMISQHDKNVHFISVFGTLVPKKRF